MQHAIHIEILSAREQGNGDIEENRNETGVKRNFLGVKREPISIDKAEDDTSMSMDRR
jgi:hypothetical protein